MKRILLIIVGFLLFSGMAAQEYWVERPQENTY